MTKTTATSILIAALLIGGAVLFTPAQRENAAQNAPVNNVAIIDGTQIITMSAKGGYTPRISTARAGIPTVIKMDTAATFDCSSSLSIPSIGYKKNLPASGETLIDVPPQEPGSVLRGLCAMGMYSFEVRFD